MSLVAPSLLNAPRGGEIGMRLVVKFRPGDSPTTNSFPHAVEDAGVVDGDGETSRQHR